MIAIEVANTGPEHIPELVLHQQRCFPTMDPEDWMTAEQFAAQLQIFPAGQHVALLDGRVVGQSSTFRISGAIAFSQHRYRQITAHNSFANHDPQGEWLYGADMSVHADVRGRGVATMLYTTRKELIRRLGLHGMVAGGGLPGYERYRAQMDVRAYVAAVVAGRLIDPTLTPQLRNGFVVRDLLWDYVDGGHGLSDHATLLVWEAEHRLKYRDRG